MLRLGRDVMQEGNREDKRTGGESQNGLHVLAKNFACSSSESVFESVFESVLDSVFSASNELTSGTLRFLFRFFGLLSFRLTSECQVCRALSV
jgi:hypothetical protein